MKFEMYRDNKKEWRWTLFARNGRIVADSGEGYKNRGHCKRMIQRIILGVQTAKVSE